MWHIKYCLCFWNNIFLWLFQTPLLFISHSSLSLYSSTLSSLPEFKFPLIVLFSLIELKSYYPPLYDSSLLTSSMVLSTFLDSEVTSGYISKFKDSEIRSTNKRERGHLLFYDWVCVALASPGTCCIDQASLQLTNTHLPLPIALTSPSRSPEIKDICHHTLAASSSKETVKWLMSYITQV